MASQIVRPCAVGRDPVGVGHAHARGGAVPGEHHVGRRDRPWRGRAARRSGALSTVDVLELELLGDVGDPAFAEAIPRPAWSTGRGAEQRPQRHLDRAGVGGRHDADAVIGRHFQHLAGQVDGALELRLADLGAVRASENRVGEGLQAPAGALGAGAGREVRDGRPHAGRIAHDSILPDRSPSLGRGVPPTEIRKRAPRVKRLMAGGAGFVEPAARRIGK